MGIFIAQFPDIMDIDKQTKGTGWFFQALSLDWNQAPSIRCAHLHLCRNTGRARAVV